MVIALSSCHFGNIDEMLELINEFLERQRKIVAAPMGPEQL
jgi:hypothetical protein